MLTIRLPKAEWGKAWRAMIEVAPVRLIGDDPIYEVLPAHLEMLDARGFNYEVVTPRPRRVEKRRHGTADSNRRRLKPAGTASRFVPARSRRL